LAEIDVAAHVGTHYVEQEMVPMPVRVTRSQAQSPRRATRSFDSTLGYPGEGPVTKTSNVGDRTTFGLRKYLPGSTVQHPIHNPFTYGILGAPKRLWDNAGDLLKHHKSSKPSVAPRRVFLEDTEEDYFGVPVDELSGAMPPGRVAAVRKPPEVPTTGPKFPSDPAGDGPGAWGMPASTSVVGGKDRDVRQYAFTGSSRVWAHPFGPAYPNEDGEVPERVGFSQLFTTVATAAADTHMFNTGTLATTETENEAQISPDTLNGPLAGRALYFDKYCFRYLRFTMLGEQGANAVGSYVMALTCDGAQLNIPTSYSTAFEAEHKAYGAQNEGQVVLEYEYPGTQLWYQPAAVGTAEARQTAQLSFVMYPSAAPSASAAYGHILVEGVVDFVCRSSTHNFTLLRTTAAEKLYLGALFKIMREEGSARASDAKDVVTDIKRAAAIVTSFPDAALKCHMELPPAGRIVPPAYFPGSGKQVEQMNRMVAQQIHEHNQRNPRPMVFGVAHLASAAISALAPHARSVGRSLVHHGIRYAAHKSGATDVVCDSLKKQVASLEQKLAKTKKSSAGSSKSQQKTKKTKARGKK
jgi:hypothetical protein